MRARSGYSRIKVLLLILVVAGVCALGFVKFHASGHTGTPAHHAALASSVKPTEQQATAHQDAQLQQIIESWAAKYSFHTSVVVRELTGDLRSATWQATDSVVPASTYKIYVAYGVLHGIELGSYTLNTKTSDGNTVQTDLNNMILNSDNDAARTLGFLVGWQNLNTLLQGQGISSTNLNNYVGSNTSPVGDKHTTAADLTTMLDKLYSGQALNQTHTQLLLHLMENQHYRERVPSGVPAGVTVADKPGWLTGNDDPGTIVQNDAAIVYGPKSTYELVITTSGSSTSPLAALSAQVYNYLEQ